MHVCVHTYLPMRAHTCQYVHTSAVCVHILPNMCTRTCQYVRTSAVCVHVLANMCTRWLYVCTYLPMRAHDLPICAHVGCMCAHTCQYVQTYLPICVRTFRFRDLSINQHLCIDIHKPLLSLESLHIFSTGPIISPKNTEGGTQSTHPQLAAQILLHAPPLSLPQPPSLAASAASRIAPGSLRL